MDDLEAKEKFGQMDVSTLFIVQRLANDFSNIGLHSHLMNNIVLKWIRPLLVCAVCTYCCMYLLRFHTSDLDCNVSEENYVKG